MTIGFWHKGDYTLLGVEKVTFLRLSQVGQADGSEVHFQLYFLLLSLSHKKWPFSIVQPPKN